MNKNILVDIREFILENFILVDGMINSAEINDDTSLVVSGLIDSMGIVEIIRYIEEKYNIIVEDDEVEKENFDSINNITIFLGKKLK